MTQPVPALALPAHLLVEITVRAHLGRSSTGDTFAAPVTVRGVLQHERKRIRRADGATVEAAGFALLPLSTTCPAGSQVTGPDGATHRAEHVARLDGGGLPTDHLDVTLV